MRIRNSLLTWVLAAWTAAGLVLAAQAWFSTRVRGDELPVAHALGTWLVWAYTWAILTPGAIWLHGHARGRHAPIAHLVAAPLFALANLAVFALFAPAIGALNAADTWLGTLRNLLGSAFIVNVPVYFLIVGIVHWRELALASRDRAARELALQHQLAEARLMTLRAQLQPHFLFNALNTIAVLMRENVDSAERVLFSLASLLRTVLRASDVHFSRVEEEFALARTYLEVEQARFGNRLDFRFEATPDALRALVPSLLLQPLVENCVQHAVGVKAGTTRVDVSAEKIGTRLHLTVRDDGPGLPHPRREGVGLSNTTARLAVLYPDEHELSVANSPHGGVEAAIAIPYRTTNEDPHAHR